MVFMVSKECNDNWKKMGEGKRTDGIKKLKERFSNINRNSKKSTKVGKSKYNNRYL